MPLVLKTLAHLLAQYDNISRSVSYTAFRNENFLDAPVACTCKALILTSGKTTSWHDATQAD